MCHELVAARDDANSLPLSPTWLDKEYWRDGGGRVGVLDSSEDWAAAFGIDMRIRPGRRLGAEHHPVWIRAAAPVTDQGTQV